MTASDLLRGVQTGTASCEAAAAALRQHAVGSDVQKRRRRSAEALAAQFAQSGRTLATAEPADVVAVLVQHATRGRTNSPDGALVGVAASQALVNVLGDLRYLLDATRDSRPWIPSQRRGNPARSCEVDELLTGYGKLLLDSGVTPQPGSAMSQADTQAWLRAADDALRSERTPDGRLRALRNASYGAIVAHIGARSVDVLRCDWEYVLDQHGPAGGCDVVLLLLLGKPARRTSQRGRAKRQEVILERAAGGGDLRCVAEPSTGPKNHYPRTTGRLPRALSAACTGLTAGTARWQRWRRMDVRCSSVALRLGGRPVARGLGACLNQDCEARSTPSDRMLAVGVHPGLELRAPAPRSERLRCEPGARAARSGLRRACGGG